MNKKELRVALKAIGYKCSFSANPFNPERATLYLIDPDSGDKTMISASTVFIGGFYERHRKALELCNKFDGVNTY